MPLPASSSNQQAVLATRIHSTSSAFARLPLRARTSPSCCCPHHRRSAGPATRSLPSLLATKNGTPVTSRARIWPPRRLRSRIRRAPFVSRRLRSSLPSSAPPSTSLLVREHEDDEHASLAWASRPRWPNHSPAPPQPTCAVSAWPRSAKPGLGPPSHAGLLHASGPRGLFPLQRPVLAHGERPSAQQFWPVYLFFLQICEFVYLSRDCSFSENPSCSCM